MDYSLIVSNYFDSGGSFLNLDFKDFVSKYGDGWYEEFMITDVYKYRLDLISLKFYDRVDFGIFILLVNDIYSFEQLREGVILKIPFFRVIYDYYFYKRNFLV